MKEKYVKVQDTIKGFKKIIDGELDNVLELSFLFEGSIEYVLNKAKDIEIV